MEDKMLLEDLSDTINHTSRGGSRLPYSIYKR